MGLKEIPTRDEQKLKKEMPKLFEGTPSQADLDNAIRFLMKNGSYASVSFERNSKGELSIVGRPLLLIEDIEFSGNSSFGKSKLIEVMELQTNGKFDRKKAVAAAEKLKAFYGESGYFNTIINLSFPKAKSGNIILKFEIKENEPCRVAALDLATDNPILKRRLLDHLSRYMNRPLTDAMIIALNRRANEYLTDYRYLTAEFIGPEVKYNEDKSKAYISYEIKEARRWEFFFEGNEFDTNLDIFRAMDWTNRDRKNVEPASEGADRIKRDYLSKGFPQVTVDFVVDQDPKQYLKKVFYTIKEGSRVELKDIEIQGRVSRAPSFYADFIRSNSSELVDRGYYNRQDLEIGFKNLITELRNQGYLRAKIQSSRIEYDVTKKFATIYVLIDEGPLTLVQTVDFEGNHFFSSYELTGVLGLTTNSPLRMSELETGIEKVKDFYRKQGFLEMKILNEGEDVVHYNESGSLARLLLKIYEGPRIRVASIRVDGNTFTKTWVVLKEANFHTGQILTPEILDNATERLNRLGLFGRVDIRTLEENTSVSERTLVITVAERDPGLFRFGAGVNNERDLTGRGFASLAYNNLWGTGRGISGRVQLTESTVIKYPENDITVSYLEPFLLDSRTRGRVNLTRSEHVFDYSSDTGLTSITVSNVISFNLERDFNRHIRGIWKLWSREEQEDFVRGPCVPGADPNVHCSPDLLYVATVGPILDFDYRDNPFAPSRGSFTRFSGEYADPRIGSSGSINFFKTELSEIYYIPLVKTSKRWVWANQGKAGYLANISGNNGSGVPVSHAFFLGGVDTVRGFDKAQDAERIPPGNELPITEGNQIIVHSDSHYFLLKSEFRFPIVGEHGGVLFYDGGLVEISGYNFRRPYRDAVGVGYRYNTPVGPVSLDIAFKIDPRKGDAATGQLREAPFRVHFSIGNF